MTDRELRLECLKLAVALVEKGDIEEGEIETRAAEFVRFVEMEEALEASLASCQLDERASAGQSAILQ